MTEGGNFDLFGGFHGDVGGASMESAMGFGWEGVAVSKHFSGNY